MAADAGCGTVPQPANAPATSTGTTLVFAAQNYFMGDMRWDGTADNQAWEDFGFNLDSIDTQDKSTRSCTGGRLPFFQDGPCGLDNSFGTLPRLASDTSSITKSELQTGWASMGRWTWLVKIVGYQPKGSFSGLSVQIFVGAPRNSPPLFDGTDVWDTADGMDSNVVNGSIQDGVITTGPIDTWIDQPMTTSTPPPLHRFHAVLHASALQMTLSADGNQVDRAIIGGAIRLDEISGSDLPCLGPQGFPMDDFADVNRALGHDASLPCDAMSFGIGFTAVRAQLGSVAPPLPPPTDCSQP